MNKTLFAIILSVLVCYANQVSAGEDAVVDPIHFDSSHTGNTQLHYTYVPQGVLVEFRAAVYGWLPTFGVITAQRRGEIGQVFRSDFEDGDGGVSIPLLDSNIDQTWWSPIPDQGPSDYVADRVIALMEASGRYDFEVWAVDQENGYLQARFSFDVDPFTFNTSSCRTSAGSQLVTVRSYVRSIEDLPQVVSRLRVETVDGVVIQEYLNLPINLHSTNQGVVEFQMSYSEYVAIFENRTLQTSLTIEGELVGKTVLYREPIIPCQG